MPKKPPAYTLHKPTGQARVRIDGRDHYLGTFDSEESRLRYDDLIADWRLRQDDPAALTIPTCTISISLVDRILKPEGADSFLHQIKACVTLMGLAVYTVTATIIARLIATVTSLWVTRFKCFLQLPKNWWNTVICTDFCTSPGLMPYLPNLDSTFGFEVYRLTAESWDILRERRKGQDFGVAMTLFGMLLTVLALPLSFSFRISVKSTAFIWYPLVWAMRPAKAADRSWEKQLQVERDIGRPQIVFAWSTFCLILLGVKYGFWVARHSAAIHATALQDALARWHLDVAPGATEWLIEFIRPGAAPLWQIATLINSLLGFFFYLRVRKWMAEYKHQVGPTDATVERNIRVTFFFRRLLTPYIIICNLWLIFQIAKKLPVPEIGSKLFPWL